MADWAHPTLVDPYADVLITHLNGRDIDAITLQKTTPSNMPNGAMAYDRTIDLLKEWNGSAFVNKKISIAGGGTGADNPTQARINLGLGSMATQNSNAVSITGGSISGVALDGSAVTAGIVALARGGTGASLGLGAASTFLQSNGSQVVFGVDGSLLNNLNATNIAAGITVLARGGTGSSLALGPFGYFLGSDGANVIFHNNGQSLVNMNASALAFGTVPLARLPAGVAKVAQTVFFADSTNSFTSINGFQQPSSLQITATSVAGGAFHLTGSVNVLASTTTGNTNAYARLYIFRSVNGGSFLQVADIADFVGVSQNISGVLVQTADVVAIDYVDNPGPAGTSVAYQIRFSLAGSVSSGFGSVNLGNNRRRSLSVVEYT